MPPVHLEPDVLFNPLSEKEWGDKYRFFSNLPADNRRCTEEVRFMDKMKGDVAGPIATGETSRFTKMARARHEKQKIREEEQARGIYGPLDKWSKDDREYYQFDNMWGRMEGYLVHGNKVRDERMTAWRRSMTVAPRGTLLRSDKATQSIPRSSSLQELT
jgi:hypothetical protein